MAVDDPGGGVGEVGLRVDAVQLAGFDERSDDRPVFGPAVGAGEERVLPRQGQGTDGPLDDVVVQLDASVVEEEAKSRPA